ncbi:MAG: ATPase domain-containing protein [Candidatus Thermoplasmatota archaeon]
MVEATRLEEESSKFVKTGIPGFDDLFEQGIPKGSTVLIAGGTGSGKTNLCLQLLAHHASQGKKCYFMGFEESENRLIEHMKDFGWDPETLIKSGDLKIKRFLTAEIYYYDKKGGSDIQAMMTKEVDPLLMELEPLSITDTVGFKPDFIVLDSLTAISSTFQGKEQSYRFYVERLFRFFEKIGATTFLITETQQIPEVFSPTGVEEFLADGVVVIYNIRRQNTREKALEVLKMRGAKHQRKIVSMNITEKGVVINPNKEVYSEIE